MTIRTVRWRVPQILATLLVAAMPMSPLHAQPSDPLCPNLVPCEYEAPGFTIRVVDKDTGKPLGGVHALAGWVAYATRGKGLLMVLEAVSRDDGVLSFPGWGPVRSSNPGLEPGRDPLVSLFHPDYVTLLIRNPGLRLGNDTDRLHPFTLSGDTFVLERLSSDPTDVLANLRRADDPFDAAQISQHDPPAFRRAWVNRMRRVREQLFQLPLEMQEARRFLKVLDDEIHFFDARSE